MDGLRLRLPANLRTKGSDCLARRVISAYRRTAVSGHRVTASSRKVFRQLMRAARCPRLSARPASSQPDSVR